MLSSISCLGIGVSSQQQKVTKTTASHQCPSEEDLTLLQTIARTKGKGKGISTWNVLQAYPLRIVATCLHITYEHSPLSRTLYKSAQMLCRQGLHCII